VSALLLIRPDRDLGRGCLENASDAVALARGVKDVLRPFVKRWSATRLMLYYFGPLGGACFIGHQLNAVCREVEIMEDQQPGYAPTFLLL
jgi:SMODS-associated and fused to various effectors sensor domain